MAVMASAARLATVLALPAREGRGRMLSRSVLVRAEVQKSEDQQDPFTPGKLSPPSAERLKSAVPSSPFNQGNRVLDAFKKSQREGRTTKFGQPLVPSNIFEEPKRTPEEIQADAFKFTVSKEAIFLVVSFMSISLVMFGTVFLVWKLGGIHYDEY